MLPELVPKLFLDFGHLEPRGSYIVILIKTRVYWSPQFFCQLTYGRSESSTDLFGIHFFASYPLSFVHFLFALLLK